MRVFKINEDIMVFKGDKRAETKFRKELSRLLLEKYSKPYYDTQTVSSILYFCRDFYIEKFEQILTKETSYTFYKQIIWLNEQACMLRQSDYFNNLPNGIDKSYIGMYRRILKLILEQGCLAKMVTGEKLTPQFRKRIEPIMDDLLFLGEMLFGVSESIAEQEVIEDAIDVDFDKNGLYVYSRRHHYEVVFSYIKDRMESTDPDFVIDNNGFEDYQRAIEECFGIDYNKFWQAIILLMQHFKVADHDCVCLEAEGFKRDIQHYIECDDELLEKYQAGLTLSSENKLSVLEVLKKPYSLNRYLTRPFLKWQINGKTFYVFSISACFEAEASLYFNSIPWQKVPSEWEDVPGVKEYASRKHDEHDKWLEDVIEQSVKNLDAPYHRNVKNLVTKNGTHSLLDKDLGEIDFLIISNESRKVYVAECKHLVGRYDTVNQRNDHRPFLVDDGKRVSYVTKLNRKVNWLKERMDIVEEHFQIKYNRSDLSIAEYEIEGIFFINTPTFLMFNADTRIYTHDQVTDLIAGKFIDPSFSYMVDSEEGSTYYNVKYPFFRKPKLYFYDNPDDDCEVDKYGYPIKKKQ